MINALGQNFNKIAGGVLSQQELLHARYMARAGSVNNQFSSEDEETIGKEREEENDSARKLFTRAVSIIDSQLARLDSKIENVQLDLDNLKANLAKLQQAIAQLETRKAQLDERLLAHDERQEENAAQQRQNEEALAETDEIITTAADEKTARAQELQDSEAPTVAVPGTEAGVITRTEIDGKLTTVMTDAVTGEITTPAEMDPETLRAFRQVENYAAAIGAVPLVESDTYSAAEVGQAQERQLELYAERSDLSRFGQLLRVEGAGLRKEVARLEGELLDLRAQKGDMSVQIAAKETELATLQEERVALRAAHGSAPPDATREELTSVLTGLGLGREWENALLPGNDRGMTYATDGLRNARLGLREVNGQLEGLDPEDPRAAALREQKDKLLLERDHYRAIYNGITEGQITGETLDQVMQDSPYADGWSSFSGAYDSLVSGLKTVAGTVADVVTGGLSGVVGSLAGGESKGSAASEYDPDGGTGGTLMGMATGAFKMAAANFLPEAAAPQVSGPAIEAQQEQMQQQRTASWGM